MQFTSQIGVRYAETDQMGIVYYANYLVWFEVGRIGLLKACGLPYSELEKKGIFMPVKEAHVNYLKPARYEDRLDVITMLSEVSRAKIKVIYEIKRGDELLATGFTIHLFTNDMCRAIRAPRELVEILSGAMNGPEEGNFQAVKW